MDTRFDILHEDIKEIKADVKELVKLAASHNVILAQHERRSTQLEERFQPVEQVYIFAAKSAAFLGILAGLLALFKTILELRG